MHEYRGTIQRWQKQTLLLVLLDYLCVVAAYGLALLLSFDGNAESLPPEHLATYKGTVFNYAWISVAVCVVFRLYRRNWREAGYGDFIRCIAASAVSVTGYWLVVMRFFGQMPVAYHVFGGLLQLGFLLISRFLCRTLPIMISGEEPKQDKAVP